EPDRFWQLKQQGIIDEFEPGERTRVPRQLLAVVRRALVSDPAQRYPTIVDVVVDLERWQAGQPVSACRETIDERLRRLLRRHGRNFLLGLAFLLPVVALVIALVG